MQLTPADLSTLSRLLDEAMDLPPAEVEPWLSRLPAEQAHLIDQLRRLLTERTGQASFMAGMPSVEHRDDSVAHEGDRVGAYRLIREIGQGGMGAVWLAERVDGRLKRRVALKLPRLAWGSGLTERMERERDIGALLEHPNIARLYDAGVDDKGRPFLALEYIDGVPLDDWCRERRPALPERLRLFLQVARAVAYAHGRLVVHRDLKPSNVLVSADGQAHLLDFGIAKLLDEAAPRDLTQREGRFLTPRYASPEQIEGKAITVASDVYSLGVLLYELLTGKRPHEARRDSIGAVEEAILGGEPALASNRVEGRAAAKALRGELDAILAKALKREPGHRYATADAFADDVERHLQGERVLAQPDSSAYRFRRLLRRHWIGLLATGCVVLAVLGGATVAVVQARRAVEAAERERTVKHFVADLFKAETRDRYRASSDKASLLDGGVSLIETRFSDQPELRAELYGVISTVYMDMGANSSAADYARRQLSVLQSMPAAREQQAGVLLRLARALYEDEAYEQAGQQVLAAQAAAGTDSAAGIDALILLARVRYAMRRLDEVKSLLARIDRLVDTGEPGPSTAKAWALELHASLQAEDRVDTAVPLFNKAIDMAESAEGKLSTTAIAIRLTVAQWLIGARDPEESKPFFTAAIAALSALGGPHATRASFEKARHAYTRAWLGKGKRADAFGAIAQSRQELLASSIAIPDWFVPQLDFWRANLDTFFGDVTRLPALLASASLLSQSHPYISYQMNIAWSLGVSLMHAGRHDEADHWLREVVRLTALGRLGMDGMASSYAAWNLIMQGRPDEALRVLDATPRPPAQADPRLVAMDTGAVLNGRTEALLLKGQADRVIPLVEAYLKDAPQTDSWDASVVSENQRVLGEAQCAVGRFAEGRRHLKEFLDYMASIEQPSFGPEWARARAVAGLCALDQGDRAEADRLLLLARGAFTIQAGVSDYYKAPWRVLEARLAERSGREHRR